MTGSAAPDLVHVLGAPGSGKSTLTPLLRAALPDRLVLDWDALMEPAGTLAGSPVRTTPATWPAYGELVRAVVEQALPPGVVLLGVVTPQEVVGWPRGRWLLLDCDDATRRSRLADRDDRRETAEALEDAAAYRRLGLASVDTTGLAPDDVARRVAAWIGAAATMPVRV